ncbi:MAG: GAF domain-containing protein [Candidatus Omnitrophica bacterium]|nr:GAF domain-containing protein [Candidatus Omnitrophota bacterium]
MIERLAGSIAGKPSEKLFSLTEISRVLGASLHLEKLFSVVLSTMMANTQADSGSLMLFDECRRELYIADAKGLSRKIRESVRIKLGEGIAGYAAQQRKPLLIDNATVQSQWHRRPRPKLKTALCIPLAFGDRLIGVVNLNRIPGTAKFSSDDLTVMHEFATESAIAINNARLYVAAEEKIQQLFRFNVIGGALHATMEREKLFDILAECAVELFYPELFAVLLVEDNACCLTLWSARPLSRATVAFLESSLGTVVKNLNQPAHLAKPLSVRAVISNRLREPVRPLVPKNLRSVQNAPIINKGLLVGMFSIYATGVAEFSDKTQQALTTLANQASIAFENVRLYKNLRRTYLSTIRALAQAIEEKDAYTRGHSEKVSEYAVAIARALKLPDSFLDTIQIAGILHDIGKIGIPESILSKPAALTAAEFQTIKAHPQIGIRILDPVDFYWGTSAAGSSSVVTGKAPAVAAPSAAVMNATMAIINSTDLSAEIKAMIYHHHERMDGKGYPQGLQGGAIPLGARILTVADAFEAMTSDRPYRQAFSFAKALRIIQDSTPSQFDPAIVAVFAALIRRRKI